MKNIMLKLFITCVLMLPITTTIAKIELYQFENNDQEILYKKLSEQLRCLVCQNQNLAGSNAELAQDMRLKTYQLVSENKTENEIIDYWISRYGDFVLYNPPFQTSTLILWLGPFILLILALYFGRNIVKDNNKSLNEKSDSDENKQAHDVVKKLLSK